MSKGPVKVSAEEAAKNQAFLASMAASGKERYIKRHSLQARLTHGITIAACILLCISGLFVFVPALAAAVGADTVFAIRMFGEELQKFCDKVGSMLETLPGAVASRDAAAL